MNKLEVGMYVRLDRNQGIRKIEEYDEDIKRYYLDDDIYDAWGDSICTIEDEKDILKSSYNIIDLIEKNDLVVDIYGNIYVVDYVFDNYVYTKTKQGNITKTLCNYQIKSIVTKEQFESMEYKVGDNNE